MMDTDTSVIQERIGQLCHQFKLPTIVVSMSSVKVRANWPAKMSHHGECDIDAERAE